MVKLQLCLPGLLAPAVLCWLRPTGTHAAPSTGGLSKKTHGGRDVELAPEACAEFASNDSKLFWTLEECMKVWSAWAPTIPESLHADYADRRLMKEKAMGMRKRGQPCVVKPQVRADGVGSEVTRHLAAWIYAEEIGCDWITPNFGYEEEGEAGPEGGTLYCHPSAAPEEFEGVANGHLAEQNLETCEMVDWLRFFHFDAPSTPEPDATYHNVTADPQDPAELYQALQVIDETGWNELPEDFRLRFTFHPSIGAQFTTVLGSWDQYKREVARNVLSQMRSNFHAFPRPWYDTVPECGYGNAQLNFAIHVRMGDRRVLQTEVTGEYFEYLHDFMDVVTDAVLAKGLEAPKFHVFTETLLPCPSRDTGFFPEFPLWPISRDQHPSLDVEGDGSEVVSGFSTARGNLQTIDAKIEPCYHATRPDDCPEKRAGAANCNADRTGLFDVEGMPLVLHVGEDVRESLSCMIQADGVLMGCSTFGHVTGLFTNGIRFFSVGCVGKVTPLQYRMVPPLAIAEYGYMYVPIDGSWRNPTLTAHSIFNGALDELLSKKGLL